MLVFASDRRLLLLTLLLPSFAYGADSDGDGLEDADETLAHLPPLVADSDGDGLYDHLDSDMDGDGVVNVDECRLGGVSGLAMENGSFELPHFGNVAANYPSSIPGWQTTDTAFEMWTNGFLGVTAYEGTQLVELNAFAVGTLYQDIPTTVGDVYLYAYSHRGRAGSDTMRFNLGPPSGPMVTIRTSTDGRAWGRFGGVITITEPLTRFAFQSVSSACGMSCGNLLDAISFTPACDLDSDGDGTPDALDTDSDGDGVPDGSDVCPGEDDATADPDGDLLCGALDSCPLDPWNDWDGDGYCGDIDLCSGFNDGDDLDADGMPDGCDSDRDGDGFDEGSDCDENDPSIGSAQTYYPDSDSDGYGDSSSPLTTCAPGVIFVLSSGDCNEGDPSINPGASETCFDLADLNCDGSSSFNDGDGDLVCDSVDSCLGSNDLLDGDADLIPDGCDACPVDSLGDSDGDGSCDSDDVCPGADDFLDSDSDGVPNGCDSCPADSNDDSDGDGSCDSADLCPGFDDLLDEDGDGLVDGCDACPLDSDNDLDDDGVCGDEDPCPTEILNDMDGDGICESLDVCPLDADNDLDSDGQCGDEDLCPLDPFNDLDADGQCGDVDACPEIPYESHRDLDGDGTVDECDSDADDDGVEALLDCDDLDPTALEASLWYLDYDRDGFGDPALSSLSCEAPPLYIANEGDCSDTRADIYPGAEELCVHPIDMNCDGSSSFDDPDEDGICSPEDACPLDPGTECDSAPVEDTSVSEEDTSSPVEDTSSPGDDTSLPPDCDTAAPPEEILVDEEDPELFRGGWGCSSSGGGESLSFFWVVLAFFGIRRASRN